MYDGFISYSHAADDLLAPRLQAGLQKFAKPWWKRRAVRIFRDESSLSANPYLWSSITDALDDSSWFILLLSPDAASSEWVNQEIAYWVANRDPKRILPVLTDGDFGWVDGEAAGSAVPSALAGVFPEEPRWVDLRFARDEEQLDLKNPRFSAAVADIASALRGVPKDELESEEVRQHRRAIRTAWAAGIVVLALAVASSVLATIAVDRSREAATQREEAQTQAEQARAAEKDAEEQAALARSRELQTRALLLTVHSTNALAESPELSLRLALDAAHLMEEAGTPLLPETIKALQGAVQASRLELQLDDGWGLVAAAPDGRVFVTDSLTPEGALSGDVLLRSVEDGQTLATFLGTDPVMALAFMPGSSLLAVGHGHVDDNQEIPPIEVGTIVLWDTDLGHEVDRLVGPSHVVPSVPVIERPMAWSPDGQLLAAASWDRGSGGVVSIWDVDAGTLITRIPKRTDAIAFADSRTLLIADSDSERIVYYDSHSGDEVDSLATEGFSANWMRLAPDRIRVVLGSQRDTAIQVWDLRSGTLEWSRTHSTPVIQDVSPDSRFVVVTGFDGIVRVFDIASSAEVLTFAGQGGVWGAAFDPSGSKLITVGTLETRIWDMRPGGDPELGTIPVGADLPVHLFISPDGSEIGFSTSTGGAFKVADSSSGEVIRSLEGQGIDFWTPAVFSPDWTYVSWVDGNRVGWIAELDDLQSRARLPTCTSPKAFSPDGSALLLDGRGVCGQLPTDQVPEGAELRSRVIDRRSGEVLLDLGYQALIVRGGSFNPGGALESGRYVTANGAGVVEIWDLQSRASLASVAIEGLTVFSAGSFDPTGRYLAGGSGEGRAWVADITKLVEGSGMTNALVANIDAHDGSVATHVLGPGGLLATSSFDGVLRLWNLEQPDEPVEIPTQLSFASFVAFSPDGKWLYYTDTGYDGYVIRRFPLDPDRLVELAESMVVRGLTADECRRFPSAPSCDTGSHSSEVDGA